MDEHWKEVMDLAQKYGFIVYAHGGTAVIMTHKVQIEEYGKKQYKKIQKMNKEEIDEKV